MNGDEQDAAAEDADAQGAGRRVRRALFVYERLERRLASQLALAELIDRKLETSMRFSAALIALLAAAIFFADRASEQSIFSPALIAAVVIIALLTSAGITVAMYAYIAFGDLVDAPDSGTLARQGASLQLPELVEWASAQVRDAISANTEPLRLKRSFCNASLVLVWAAALAVSVSAVVAVAA